MLMKKLIFGFLIIFLISSCASTGNDLVSTTPSLYSNAALVWDRPSEMTLDIQNTIIEGSYTASYVLGYPTGKNVTNVPQIPALNQDGGVGGYDSHTLNAIADAVKKANADSMQIIKITSETNGFVPFFWTKKITVSGRAIRLNAAQMSVERSDEERALRAAGLYYSTSSSCTITLMDAIIFPVGVAKYVLFPQCRHWSIWGGF